MAVARIHGKVRCRPFERKEEDTANKTWLGFASRVFVSLFLPSAIFFMSPRFLVGPGGGK